MKKTVALVGAGAIVAASVLIPIASASADPAPPVGTLCNDGTFHVVSNGTISDKFTTLQIKKGHYKIKVSGMTCGKASILFHNFREHTHVNKHFRIEPPTWGLVMFAEPNGTFFQVKRV